MIYYMQLLQDMNSDKKEPCQVSMYRFRCCNENPLANIWVSFIILRYTFHQKVSNSSYSVHTWGGNSPPGAWAKVHQLEQNWAIFFSVYTGLS